MLRFNRHAVPIISIALMFNGLFPSRALCGGGKEERTVQPEGARYLVITHDNFYDAVLPLAQWKHKKGMMTKVMKLSEIGSSGYQIKQYITDAYFNWPVRPEYVLLVGDTEFLPSYYSLTYTDNYYGDTEGDYRAEIVVGRFSVDSPSHCETMVSKTLGYERTPWLENPDWFSNATLIVRDDYDSGDSIYYNDTWAAQHLLSHGGYVEIDTLFRKNGADAWDVVSAINDGRTFVNYRGTGVTNWWQPFWVNPYSTDNGFQLPIVISGTCGTGSFHDDGYICEDWVRAGTPGTPKGAVGFFGTNTIGSGQWLSQMRGAVDRGFFESIFLDSVFTLGGACLGGKLNLYQLHHSQREYEGWNLLGDPELNLQTSAPETLAVAHPCVVPAGPSEFPVTVTHHSDPVPSALVCVLMDTTVYEYGYTDTAGALDLSINPVTQGDLQVTATAHGYLPYEGECSVVGVEEEAKSQLPMTKSQSLQIFPNPFSRSTAITYSLPPRRGDTETRGVRDVSAYERINLSVYDLSGRLVKVLVDQALTTDHWPPDSGLKRSEGGSIRLITAVSWDGRDEEGRLVPGGIYLCQLRYHALTLTRKLILLR